MVASPPRQHAEAAAWMRPLGRLAVLVIGAFLSLSCFAHRGEITGTYEASGPIGIRIVQREEVCWPCLAGSYHALEARAPGGDRWRPVMTFRHDDFPSFGQEAVTVVDDRVAFVVMGWMYAVTTDGGREWSTWDAAHDLPGFHYGDNYHLIAGVTLTPDGSGTMLIDVIHPNEPPHLVTTDFGRTWTLPN